MDPATMAALASAGMSLFGGKQLGGIAPAFNSGAPPGTPLGGLLGGGLLGQDPLQGALGAVGQGQAAQQPGPLQTPGLPALNPVLANDQVSEIPESSFAPRQPAEEQGGFAQGFGNFMGGIDKGMQSPSQMLGLGLLSRLGGNSNALPLGGLLGMGLFNRNR